MVHQRSTDTIDGVDYDKSSRADPSGGKDLPEVHYVSVRLETRYVVVNRREVCASRVGSKVEPDSAARR